MPFRDIFRKAEKERESKRQQRIRKPNPQSPGSDSRQPHAEEAARAATLGNSPASGEKNANYEIWGGGNSATASRPISTYNPPAADGVATKLPQRPTTSDGELAPAFQQLRVDDEDPASTRSFKAFVSEKNAKHSLNGSTRDTNGQAVSSRPDRTPIAEDVSQFHNFKDAKQDRSYAGEQAQSPDSTLSHRRRSSVSRKPLNDDARVADLSQTADHPLPPIPPTETLESLIRRSVEYPSSSPRTGHHPTKSGDSVRSVENNRVPPTYSPTHAPSPITNKRTAAEKSYLVRDAPTAPSLEGIVDLTNTTDTTIHESWAPAVTHETIHTHHHHIREELITREIHQHDVYHRTLPIIDIEVLPTRHFILDPDDTRRKIEVDASQIPGRTKHEDWVIAETVSKLKPGEKYTGGKRHFTARTWLDGEGLKKEWTDKAGVERSDQTWVHEPVACEGARVTGQSVPFHFGEPGKKDGIRWDLS